MISKSSLLVDHAFSFLSSKKYLDIGFEESSPAKKWAEFAGLENDNSQYLLYCKQLNSYNNPVRLALLPSLFNQWWMVCKQGRILTEIRSFLYL